MLTKPAIFITSNEPWGPLWFSKQHYAYELAKLGYNVYFINPVKKYSLKNLFSFNVNVQQVPEGLTVISYKNNFPVRLFPRLFIFFNDLLNILKFKNSLNLKNKKIIWWQFDFLRFINLPFLKNVIRIYHVVDPYMDNSLDKIIAAKADMIVIVTEKFLPYYKKNNPDVPVLHIPHAISNDDRITHESKKNQIEKKYGKYVFFAGTLNRDVNLDLFRDITDQRYHLVVAGTVSDLSPEDKNVFESLKNKSNFTYTGMIDVMELKNYIAASTVCITAYRSNQKKPFDIRTPLKIIKYIAQNKTVITSIDSGIPELENKAIYKASNSDEFLDLIKRAFRSELTVDKTAVDKYLNEHTYPEKIQKILNELDKTVINRKK